jgi:hypothetical protein
MLLLLGKRGVIIVATACSPLRQSATWRWALPELLKARHAVRVLPDCRSVGESSSEPGLEVPAADCWT